MTPKRFILVPLLFAQTATLAFAQEVRLEPQRLSPHCWFFQGEQGVRARTD